MKNIVPTFKEFINETKEKTASKDKLRKILTAKSFSFALEMHMKDTANLEGKDGKIYSVSVAKETEHPYNKDKQNSLFYFNEVK